MSQRFWGALLGFIMLGSSILAQNNILNNGGFESGLMCYGHWIWSTTGKDFLGDYQFRLSTDAHSGSYSAEISCVGKDCEKAAIYTDRMTLQPSRNYRVSTYAKCPSGTSAFLFIPGTANGDVVTDIVCNNGWNLNIATFRTRPQIESSSVYIYLRNRSWVRIDDAVLTFSDKTAPPPQTLHAGRRDVKISGQKVLVDGAPFLSLGFFDVPLQDLPMAAATGANTINGFPGTGANCFNSGQKDYLDQLYELGLTFVPESASTTRTQTPPVFAAAGKTFGPHLANIAWFLADEPDHPEVAWLKIPPATLTADYAALKTETTLPTVVDFQTGSHGELKDIAPYDGTSDIWMAEPYGPDFGRVDHAIQLFNSVRRRPIWLAQNDVDAAIMVPKAYWVIIGGATGIHYFTWTAFKADAAKLAAAKQVFSELKGLKNAIFGESLDSLVTASQGIAAMSRFDPATGISYILAAHASADTIKGNIAVKGLKAGQVINVLYENRTIQSENGWFSDPFAGVSRHVYSVDCKARAGSGWEFCRQ